MLYSNIFVLPALLALAAAPAPTKPITPGDVVAAAPHSSWQAIRAEDLLLIDLDGGARVIVQLAPEFAPVHVANIRALARSAYWQGASVYRVQDNYVVQWGIGDVEKALPPGAISRPPDEYSRPMEGLSIRPMAGRDSYSPKTGHVAGWPVAYDLGARRANLTHCYASVGVARDVAPDTGSGGELYAVIGHAPRQLDRNIAIVGRVIEGIEAVSSLPRGSGPLGFYTKEEIAKSVVRVGIASDLPVARRPRFEYLTETSDSFARFLHLRANRNDDFYKTPTGGVDLCNAPVPVRRSP